MMLMASFNPSGSRLPWAICTLLVLALAACEKKAGQAIVLSKEHIPASRSHAGGQKEPVLTPEQWKVLVEMRSDYRKVDVLVERAEWERMQIGDPVRVRYSQGKYTGTVWSSEIQ